MTAALDLSEAIADLVEANGKGIVRIEARRWGGATGTIWTDDGLIVTAHHVLERDENVTVTTHDGATHTATVVGRDPGTDLAVLKVDANGLTRPNWSELDGVRVGNLTVALGRPGRTVRASWGILGAIGDAFRTPRGGKVDRYVQTDGVVPPGFSGGPLLDLKGRVLGVNTTGLLRGVNVAVPTATVQRVVGEVQTHGQVRKGYLGVGVYPVRLPDAVASQLAGQHTGLALVAIEPGSPADKGGLLIGDVIVSVDGNAVARPGDLSALLEDRIGKQAGVRVVRAGALTDVKATVGQRP